MKAIKIGRCERRVVFENTSKNWEWLKKYSKEPIDKPCWAMTEYVPTHKANLNENDSFLFLRQYYKHVNGYTDDQSAMTALFKLWKYDTNRRFEEHLLHHRLISKDSTTSIEGELLCEHVETSNYGNVSKCFVRTYFRKDGKYRCAATEWVFMYGHAFNLMRRKEENCNSPYYENYILVDVEPEIILNAIKWKRYLVWFEKDIRMVQMDCLFSKQ